jgi:hypothetical protein
MVTLDLYLNLVRLVDSLVDFLMNLMGVLHLNYPMRATPVMSTIGTMTMTAEYDDSPAVPIMVMATGGANVSAVNPRHNVTAAMMTIVIIMITNRQTIEPAAGTSHHNANNYQ